MEVRLSKSVLTQMRDAPPAVQRAFVKQLNQLVRDIRHPSLNAKKFDVEENLWQARVNQDWRFYFRIEGAAYLIRNLTPHPK